MNKKSEPHQVPAVDFASTESLEIALKYFSLLGNPPASFSSAIRSMLSDHARKLETLSSASRFFGQRLLRGRAIMTPMQQACALFKGKGATGAMSARELMDSLRPDEAGALFGLFYYARRAKSICDNQEEWQHVSRHFELHINTGVVVGQAIPQVGLCLGMLTGGLPSLTLAAFLQHDLNGFKEYRRHLKSSHQSFDHKAEIKKWGCTSIQIATIMVQALGFGVELADLFRLISVEGRQNLGVNHALLARLCVAEQWITALASRGEAPEPPSNPAELELYPSQETATRLVSEVCEIRENSARYAWLDRHEAEPCAPAQERRPAPAPAEAQPAIQQTSSQPQTASAEGVAPARRYTYADIPEELRSVISEEEFNAMDPEQAQAFLADIGLA